MVRSMYFCFKTLKPIIFLPFSLLLYWRFWAKLSSPPFSVLQYLSLAFTCPFFAYHLSRYSLFFVFSALSQVFFFLNLLLSLFCSSLGSFVKTSILMCSLALFQESITPLLYLTFCFMNLALVYSLLYIG